MKNIHIVFIIAPFMIYSLIISLLYTEDVKHYINQLICISDNYLPGLKQDIRNEIQRCESDILYLADCYDKIQTISSGRRPRQYEVYQAFILNRKVYEYLALFDNGFREMLRIDFYKGIAHIFDFQNQARNSTPEQTEQLKNTVGLDNKTVFISSPTLVIEEGEVKKPSRPVMYFTTPIPYSVINHSGYVMLRYSAQKIFDYLERYPHEIDSVEAVLLNNRGYRLNGGDQIAEYGFLLDDSRDQTFAKRYPREWELMNNMKNGHFLTDAGLFSFTRIYINQHYTVNQIAALQNHYMTAVFIYPEAVLHSARISILHKHVILFFIVTLVLAAIELLIIRNTRIKQNAAAKERRQIEAYNRFVPKEFLKLLHKDSITEIEAADCRKAEMAILFSDIRSFTSISEGLKHTEIFTLLNEYFNIINPVISKHNGIIDKFIGDAIMALFTEHPENGIKTAISIKERLQKFNELQKSRGKTTIKTGFGLHYGELSVGTLGSAERMETTVIGDTVNISSRLESATKMYSTGILISESLYSVIPVELFKIREIDTVRFKGKGLPVKLYEVYNNDTKELITGKDRIMEDYLKAIALYKKADFNAALELLASCLKENPDDNIVPIYIKRCKTMLRMPPCNNWTGVSTL